MSTEATAAAVGGLFPSTPPPKKEAPQPDAHEGRINGVGLIEGDGANGHWTALKISLSSVNEAFDTDLTAFLPPAYAADPQVDYLTLPTGEVVTGENPDGSTYTYTKGNQQADYAKTVRNSKGDGLIETLFNIADSQGLVNGQQFAPPTSAQGLADVLNGLLVGAQVVFTRSADKNPKNPEFADQLRVRRVLNAFEKDGTRTVDNPKRFKNQRKAWAK